MIRPIIIIRRFRRDIVLKAISIFCLSLSFACLLILIAYTTSELSFDRFHSNANRIVRLTTETKEGLEDARIYGSSKIYDLSSKVPGIVTVTRVSSVRQASIYLENKIFNINRVYYVDSTFFKVFDFKIKVGDKVNPFPTTTSIVVSENFAKKYFGTEDIIGKTIKMSSKEMDGENPYTISGIIYDFPNNSHFLAEALVAMPKGYEFFAYTYLLLQSDIEVNRMADKVTAYYKGLGGDSTQIPKSRVQPIRDIHLHSNKAREMELNGNFQSLILIITAVGLILIIALINLSNNSRVMFLKNRGYYILKRTHGASIGNLILEELVYSMLLGLFIVLFGYWFVFYIDKLLGNNTFGILSIMQLLAITCLFVLVLLLVMVLPIIRYFIKDFFARNRQLENRYLSKSKSLAMRGFIIAQVTISVFVTIMTIGVTKQMDYVLNTQLGGKSDSIIVLPSQPEFVTKNYDKLKEELLRDPRIIGVTAAMEPPAGAIKDLAKIELEGKIQDSPIDLLCIDKDFFNFFNLNVIAGTMLPRYPYNFDWELQTIVSVLSGQKPKIELIKADKFSDSFIINKLALSQLGFKNAQEAIGKRIELSNHPVLGIIPGGVIVGVVDDFKYTSMFEKERPLLIMQRRLFITNFLIRYDSNHAKETLVSIKEKWQKVNGDYPFNYEFLPDMYKNVYYNEFNTKRFLTYFSILSLLISALGLAVMMSFYIRYRIKEIGIRKVNGASAFDILTLLNKNLIVWVIIALCIASPIAYFALIRWQQNFAYQTPISWWVFIVAGSIAMFVALFTVCWQSFKAARMNPVEAIRYE